MIYTLTFKSEGIKKSVEIENQKISPFEVAWRFDFSASDEDSGVFPLSRAARSLSENLRSEKLIETF